MKIKKSELKQIIKESVKQVLREGVGSAYELKIDGLCVDKINILHNNEKGKVGFTATLKSGDVEWLAEDYYDRVSSDGIYYDGDLVMDYDNSKKRINGGKIKGYFYIDEFEDDIRQDEYDENDMIRFLKDVLTDFKITNTIGGGYSHTNLEKDIVFHNTEVKQDWSYTTIHVDEMLINAPEISEAINWFFANCYKFDEIFGDNEDE